MRRSAVLSLVAVAAILAAGCSSDDQQPGPMEPAAVPAPDNQGDLVLRCRNHGLIVVQLAAILSPKPPKRLFQEAVVRFALVEFALLTRKKALAQTRALDLIDFLVDNRSNLINPNSPATATRLSNVIDAILCIVGLQPAGANLGPNTGIGVVPANNPQQVIITTPQGNAGLLVPPNFAPDTDVNGNPIPGVVVTVTGKLTTPLNTPLDQYGQTVDLTASQEVEWREGGVIVALCVNADDALFNRLRIGHQGGLGPFFGLIEILPAAAPAQVGAILGTCSPGSGSRTTFGALRDFAARVLLPAPLQATAAAIAVTGGVGGTTKRFSPFRAVDPVLQLVALPTSTNGTAGAEVENPPSVLVRTQTLLNPISGIDVEFVVPDGSPGEVTPGEVTTNGSGVAATGSWVLGLGENTVIATPQSPIPAITFTPESQTFTAQGAPPPPDFGATDWSFLIQEIVPDGNGWTTLPWPVTDEGWSQGTAPFGSVSFLETSPSGCDDQAPTDWPTNNFILLRRDFFVPEGTTSVEILVRIDNDIQVFVNGDPLSAGLLSHEGCAKLNLLAPFTVTAESGTLIPGAVNQLAVLGRDRGTESYVDVQVTLAGD